MPRHAWNKAPADTKRRYFELLRQGASGSTASQQVGVSLSCGSLWFIDAGSVTFIDKPISSRYLTQDDRIEIADGLKADEPVKSIADRIGKTYQTVYREIARNKKPDGRYQPWYAHAQAHQRRRRPRGDASPRTTGCALRSPASSTTTGRRNRSVGGYDDAGQSEAAGICATRRSTRPSTAAWWPRRTCRRCALAGPTGASAVGAAPVTEP